MSTIYIQLKNVRGFLLEGNHDLNLKKNILLNLLHLNICKEDEKM